MVPDVHQPRQCVVGDERADALCFNLFVLGCGQQGPLDATDADVAGGGVGAAGIGSYLGFERLLPVTFAQQGCMHADVATVPHLPGNWDRKHEAEAGGTVTYDDGGRAAWENRHREGPIGDCVPRAIAIALDRDYGEVWHALETAQRQIWRYRERSVDDGTFPEVSDAYLKAAGWQRLEVKVSTPIASATLCQLLPSERVVVEVHAHFFASVGGQARDVWDASWRRAVAVWIRKDRVFIARQNIGEYLYAPRKPKAQEYTVNSPRQFLTQLRRKPVAASGNGNDYDYTLKVQVNNGTTNPSLVVDVDFNRQGLLLLANKPLFIKADLDAAGLPASVAKHAVEETSPEVLSHALRIDDARVSFDKEGHPRLVAAMDGDLDALDRRVWEKRERDKQNAFLRAKGYRWEKREFYVGGEIGDMVTRWFLINPEEKAVVGSKPGMWGVETFGNLERLLTELGFYGDAAVVAQVEADLRRAEQRAALEIVNAANLTWRNEAGSFVDSKLPTEIEMFHISNDRATYGLEAGIAIWVAWWDAYVYDLAVWRFPWNAQVAEALQTLRR